MRDRSLRLDHHTIAINAVFLLLAIVAWPVTLVGVAAFSAPPLSSPPTRHCNDRIKSQQLCGATVWRAFASLRMASTNGEMSSSSSDTDNILALGSSASRLSHVMLKVPSVDETVQYWQTTANGQITASSKLDSDNTGNNDELRSAFVALGNGKTVEDCFALELVQNKEKSFRLGNVITYLGVSKLIQYSSPQDLIKIITGQAKSDDEQVDEPNGIPVQFCASAPGDYFCRLCFHTSDMEATTQFYTEVLGMTVAAADDQGSMLCLRYQSDVEEEEDGESSFSGAPTTLVFQPLPGPAKELDQGNCLDHFVIATGADMDQVYEQLKESVESKETAAAVFMKPTVMFGKKVVGIVDPNGIRVILAGDAD